MHNIYYVLYSIGFYKTEKFQVEYNRSKINFKSTFIIHDAFKNSLVWFFRCYLHLHKFLNYKGMWKHKCKNDTMFAE